MKRKSVLILCTGNSARSQMAEGILRHLRPEWDVESAGSKPSGQVRPEAIEAMREIGLDITSHHSKHLDVFGSRHFDVVMTVCDNANHNCPVYPATTERVHWSFDDPHTIDDFRRVREEIRAALEDYLLTVN
jgi:arsenate reductase (thioredoxin)